MRLADLPIATGKFIVAHLERERTDYGSIPVVLLSNHPRFVVGTRLDYGFLHIALDEGYAVFFVAREIPERTALWQDGHSVAARS